MKLLRPNYVFIDYENIQAIDWKVLADQSVHTVLFLGVHQKTLPVEVTKKGLSMKGRFDIVESPGKGKNAVDFQMAFYAGQVAAKCSNAYIHFVTRDAGFDALVACICRKKRLTAERVESVAELRFLNLPDFGGMTLPQRREHALAHLRKMGNCRPKKKKTLLSTLATSFAKQLDEKSVQAVYEALVAGGKVTEGEKEAVLYTIS